MAEDLSKIKQIFTEVEQEMNQRLDRLERTRDQIMLEFQQEVDLAKAEEILKNLE